MPLAGLLLRHRLRTGAPLASPALGPWGILKRGTWPPPKEYVPWTLSSARYVPVASTQAAPQK